MHLPTPYAALFMRLAVGGVFLLHGIDKLRDGVGGTAAYLSNHGIPFAAMFAVVLITIETVGAASVLLGMLTRAWATAMAVEMAVAILVVRLPAGQGFELEALLLAGALTLMALGDGPLSLAVRFKRPPG
ncbi:MAG: DoxX family protein [Gemmatimonadales bacterium]